MKPYKLQIDDVSKEIEQSLTDLQDVQITKFDHVSKYTNEQKLFCVKKYLSGLKPVVILKMFYEKYPEAPKTLSATTMLNWSRRYTTLINDKVNVDLVRVKPMGTRLRRIEKIKLFNRSTYSDSEVYFCLRLRLEKGLELKEVADRFREAHPGRGKHLNKHTLLRWVRRYKEKQGIVTSEYRTFFTPEQKNWICDISRIDQYIDDYGTDDVISVLFSQFEDMFARTPPAIVTFSSWFHQRHGKTWNQYLRTCRLEDLAPDPMKINEDDENWGCFAPTIKDGAGSDLKYTNLVCKGTQIKCMRFAQRLRARRWLPVETQIRKLTDKEKEKFATEEITFTFN